MTEALIRLDWQARLAAMTEAAIALKNHALEVAALIGKVNNATTQEAAVQAQREIAEILTQAEKARKAAKEPALAFGRHIDESARAFVQELKDEQLRLAKLVGDFQQLEQAKARAAEQARLAEERQIQEERRQAELAALRVAEVERQKLAEAERELAIKAAAAKSKLEQEALARHQIELEQQRALSEAKTHEELDRINEAANNAQAALAERPKYEPARAAGQRVVDNWDVAVTDIHLLYRAHPSCVSLVPLIGEIKSLLKAGVTPKGVRATPIVKSTTTRGKNAVAIDV